MTCLVTIDGCEYGAGMHFGFRLPGSFRVGISDKGRVTAGASFGPFSVSGGVGGAQCTPQGVFRPGLSLEAFAAQAEAAGFSTQSPPARPRSSSGGGWPCGQRSSPAGA